MALPAVSILLPVWNAEPYLGECIESLQAQTFGDFEIVAVDDGSEDESREILEVRAREDPRLEVVSRPHEGLIATLNAGLDLCRSDLVARMDADDLADARRLELQVAPLNEDPGLDVVSCLVRHFPDSAVGRGFRVYEDWLNSLVEHDEILRDRFIESPLPHPSVTLRRRALVEVGGYRDLGWPEDYDLWLRLAAAGRRFLKVEETLVWWRQHDERLTRTDRRYAVERFLACKAHHLVGGPLRNAERVIVWGAGQTGRRLSKHLIRGGAPLDAFIDVDPEKIGRTLRGRPIHPAEDLPRLLDPTVRTILVTAVSSRGARALIRDRLTGLGLEETRDFWCAA